MTALTLDRTRREARAGRPAIASMCLAALLSSAAPAMETTPRAPWGVYQGAGCEGAQRLEGFTEWFGRRPERGLDFFSWEAGESGWRWVMRCWASAGMTQMTFSVPMLPADGSTLAEGAAGKFDAVFARLAADLVENGFGSAVIRLGWEFNGDWYPWAARKDPQAWVAYWRRIVDVMRRAPGAAFKFDWCAATGWTALLAKDVYPGDEYVDYIGLDVYNATWDPKAVTPELRWEERLHGRHGLKWHREFAAEHSKQLSYPEWGTGERPDGHGVADDPHFIEQMAAWIAANDVAYHNYWDYRAKEYDGRISDGTQPDAAAAFLSAFDGKRPRRPVLHEAER